MTGKEIEESLKKAQRRRIITQLREENLEYKEFLAKIDKITWKKERSEVI